MIAPQPGAEDPVEPVDDEDPPEHYTTAAWTLLGAMLIVETLIQLGGSTDWAADRLRLRLLDWFAFFGDLPAAQAPWRLFSHVFVHSALAHLAVSVVLFLLIGPYLCRRIGWARFLVLFFAAGAAAALMFGQTRGGPVPLSGATGAVFGLIGAAKAWEFRLLYTQGGPWRRYAASVALVVAVAVALHLGSGGGLPVEAQLAGLASGVALAPLLAERPVGRLAL